MVALVPNIVDDLWNFCDDPAVISKLMGKLLCNKIGVGILTIFFGKIKC
jgi:hypothetical protein